MKDENTYNDISFEIDKVYKSVIHVTHPNEILEYKNICEGTIAIDDFSGITYKYSNGHWGRLKKQSKSNKGYYSYNCIPGPCY